MDVTFYEDLCYFSPTEIPLHGDSNGYFEEIFSGQVVEGSTCEKRDSEDNLIDRIDSINRLNISPNISDVISTSRTNSTDRSTGEIGEEIVSSEEFEATPVHTSPSSTTLTSDLTS